MGGIPEVRGEPVEGRVADSIELIESAWWQEGDELSLDLLVRIGVVRDTADAVVRLSDGPVPDSADAAGGLSTNEQELPPALGVFTRTTTPEGTGTLLRARIPVEPQDSTLGVRVHVNLAGSRYEIPVRGEGLPMPLARRWRRDDPHKAAAHVDAEGHMVIRTERLFTQTASLWGRLWSRLTGSGVRSSG